MSAAASVPSTNTPPLSGARYVSTSPAQHRGVRKAHMPSCCKCRRASAKPGLGRLAVAAQLLRVPELDAVAHADERRLARQARGLAQLRGDEHAALLVRLAGGGHGVQPAAHRWPATSVIGRGGQLFGKQLPLRDRHTVQAGRAALAQQAERDDERVAPRRRAIWRARTRAPLASSVWEKDPISIRPRPSFLQSGAAAAPARAAGKTRPQRMGRHPPVLISIHHFAPFVTT